MRIRHFLLTAFLLCLTASTIKAVPAKNTWVVLYQPDGSSFMARLVGDEFQHFLLTSGGSAVTRDADHWYSYQLFDENGGRYSSGVHVGTKADASVVSASSMIPYDKINAIARKKRLSRDTMMLPPATKGLPPAEKHGIVILAEFKDVHFQHTKAEFQNLLTKAGYSVNGATGCAKEYFDDQFEGKVNFHFDVTDIVTVSQNRSYYGGNDKNGSDKAPHLMVKEAVMAVDSKIDFSQYDDDKDGVVDNVFVFFAGADEAEYGGDDCIWSHAWGLYSGAGVTLKVDGKYIDSYACTSEISPTSYTQDFRGNIKPENYVIAGIGTFCHEYSHTMGLPDFYDTNYETDGISDALWGRTSIMDSGSYNNNGNTPPYFNAIEREIMGLVVPVQIPSGTVILEPIHTSNTCYIVNGRNENEYYLFECRNPQSTWDSFIGGRGLLVYHVDKSMNKVTVEGDTYTAKALWDEINCVNASRAHQCVDILEANPAANGKASSRTGQNPNDIFFPYSSYNSITKETAQKLKFWNGDVSDVTITNIGMSGSNVKMTVYGGAMAILPPTVKELTVDRTQDAAIVNIEASRPFEGELVIRYNISGYGTAGELKLKPYKSGFYATVIENLKPKTPYEIHAGFILNGIEGEESTNRFMTLSVSDNPYPFITFNNIVRTADGVFPSGTRLPLRIAGITGYDGVSWSLDGKDISVGDDCYYTVTKSGVLRADVAYPDGTHEIIVKKLIVK